MAVKASNEVTLVDQTDIDSLVTWYRLTTSATKPAAPTTTKTSDAVSGWTTAEPTFSAGDATNYLYTVQQTRWKDGACEWGSVQLSSSYEQAKQAWNKANAAMAYTTAEIKKTNDAIALRVTKTEFDALEVGGRNLARGTAFATDADLAHWFKNQNPILSVEDGSLKIVGNQTSSTPGAYTPISVEEGSCTLSFWYKAITSGGAILSSTGLWNNTSIVMNDNCGIEVTDTDWHFYKHTFELDATQATSINRLYIFLHQAGHTVSDGLYINRLKIEKGTKATDWTPAPEDVDAAIDKVDGKTSVRLHLRRDNWTDAQWGAYCSIGHADSYGNTNNSSSGNVATGFDATTLNAGDLIVIEGISTVTSIPYSATAKVTAVPASATASISATVISANNAKAIESRVKSAETSITQNAEQIALRAKSSDVYTKTELKDAKDYVANAKSNYGYQYAKDITIYGDSDKYYPVYFTCVGFPQTVTYNVMIMRNYSEQAPNDWNPSSSAHHGSLNLHFGWNFGGWGGATYKTEIYEFAEMYSTILGDILVGKDSGMFSVVYLRGGGTTGALYHVYSDVPFTRHSYMTNAGIVGENDIPYPGIDTGTVYAKSGDTYKWTIAAPLSAPNTTHLTELYTVQRTAEIETRITNAETSITQTSRQIELKANASDVYTKTQAFGDLALYTPVDWLQGNSDRTSRIDTGYVVKTWPVRMRAVVLFPSLPTGEHDFWGNFAGGGTAARFVFGTYSSKWYMYSAAAKQGPDVSANVKYDVSVEYDGGTAALIVDGDRTEYATGTSDPSATATNHVGLFSGRGDANYCSHSTARIYESQFYEADALLFDFVPVKRISDSALGMLNLVDRVFHPCIGGAFTAGEELSWIEVLDQHDRGRSDYDMTRSQAEFKVTTDGITSMVSKTSSAKYLETVYQYALSSIRIYAAENYTGTWAVTDTKDAKAGDTVYLKVKDSTRNCYVYIKATVTAVSGKNVTCTSHGYEDVLPVDTIKSTINQSSDSVKIQAKHVEIDGAAIFSNSAFKAAADAAYDAKGSASAVQTNLNNLEIGGANLVGQFNLTAANDATYDYLTGTLTSTTTENTANSSIYLQVYSNTTVIRQIGNGYGESYVGKLCNWTFEKKSDFNRIRVKFNGNKRDAAVFWDVSSIPNGTKLSFSCILKSISSDGKGNGGVISGINLRTGNASSQWSLAPEDESVGGRNLYKSVTAWSCILNGSMSSYSSDYHGKTLTATANGSTTRMSHIVDETDVAYAISFIVTSSVNAGITIDVCDNAQQGFSVTANTPTKIVCVSKPTRAIDSVYHFIDISASVAGTYKFEDVKVEKGTKATDWTPAPEEVDASISAVANNAAPKSSAVARTQRIYWRATSNTKPSANTTWLSTSGDGYGNWSLNVPQLTKGTTKYPFLYTAVQTQTVAQQAAGSTCTCSTVMIDDSTTVIDGGHIITNSIDAEKLNVTDINASNSLSIGALDSSTQTKVNNGDSAYSRHTAYRGTCSTAAATAAKAVTCTGFALETGATVEAYCSTANTADVPTLNVNSTGAKAVWVNGAVASASNPCKWQAGDTVTFTYDGTRFRASMPVENYITADSSGIKIHMAGNSTTYQHQTADATTFYVGSKRRTKVGATGLQVYVDSGNDADLAASFTADGAQIGKSGESHILQDYHSLQMVDKEGNTYFHVSDMRGTDGAAEITDTFSGNGSTKRYSLSFTAANTDYTVTVSDGSGGTVTKDTYWVDFSTAPAIGATITVTYQTVSIYAKAYTLGIRGTGGVGAMSMAEGRNTVASGECSHAEGLTSKATGGTSHAEGYATKASGYYAHSEGYDTKARGVSSHAEGEYTESSGYRAHAEGSRTIASGTNSHAQNCYTTAAHGNQTTIGKYNNNQSDNAFEIGNGTSDSARSNALVVDWNGNIIAQGMAGMVQMFAGSTAPTGWLMCDGSAVSRTTYATLFSVIGTTWGSGDGSTTFNLPDLRGRAPVGAGTGSGLTARSLAAKGGSQNIQAHTHAFTQPTVKTELLFQKNAASGSAVNRVAGSNLSDPAATSTYTAAVTGGAVGAVSGASTGTAGNMPPFTVVNFIICTGKTS